MYIRNMEHNALKSIKKKIKFLSKTYSKSPK